MITLLKKLKHRHAPVGSFGHNVITLMTGTAIAQAIPALLSPIITRIYSPQNFGIFGIYISIVSIASTIVTLRYDQALVLPKEDADAVNLMVVALLSSLGLSMLAFIIIWLFHPFLMQHFSLCNYAWFLPLSIFLLGIYQTFNAWSTRKKEFYRASFSQISRSVTVSGTQILMGIRGEGALGLVGGSILGDLCGTATLAWQVIRKDTKYILSHCRWQRMRKLAKDFLDFPLFSGTQNLINEISQNLPVILFGYFFGASVAGFYVLGVRVIQAPMSLVLTSLRQVFFQKACETHNEKGNTYRLFSKLTISLFAIALVPTLILMIWGPQIFSFFFGSQWVIAGEYARWLVLWLYVGFSNVAAVVFYQVLRKQNVLFLQDLLLLISRGAAILYGGIILKDALKTVILYSIVGSVFNFSFILVMNQFLNKRKNNL